MDNILNYQISDTILEELTSEQKKYFDDMVTGGKESDLGDDTHNHLFAHYNNGDIHAEKAIMPFKPSLFRKNDLYNRDIADHIHNHGGWTIHDYDAGIATRKLTTKKGFVKPEFKSIGSILQETGGHLKKSMFKTKNGYEALDLNKGFMKDESRSGGKAGKGDLQIVFSRNKHDVAGMSTGRGWLSCMRLPDFDERGEMVDKGGAYHKYLSGDMKHKTIVAYLTKKGDDSIQNPIARIAVKRFTNVHGHNIWRPEERHYGAEIGGFDHVVKHVMMSHYPSYDNEEYKKNKDLYNDSREHWNDTLDYDTPNEASNTKIISKKTNNYHMLHTDNDEPSYHKVYPSSLGDIHHKQWHNNGILHRENGPAVVMEIHHADGKVYPLNETYYMHGHVHAPKDGKTPASRTISYDPDMTPKSITTQYTKFDMPHNSVIHGFAESTLTKNYNGSKLTLKQFHYGDQKTDNEMPSHLEIESYNSGSHTINKSWHTADGNKKYNSESFDDNGEKTGSILSYLGSKATTEYQHRWDKKPDGTYKGEVSLPINRNTIKVYGYEHEKTPHETTIPGSPNRIEFRGENGALTYSGDNNVPAYWHDYGNGQVKYNYLNENGHRHRENGFAEEETWLDEDKKLSHYKAASRINGNIPENPHRGIIDHEWKIDRRDMQVGTLTKKVGDLTHDIRYSGPITEDPTYKKMISRKVYRNGMLTDGADGSPSQFSKEENLIHYRNQPHNKPSYIRMERPGTVSENSRKNNFVFHDQPLENGGSLSVKKYDDKTYMAEIQHKDKAMISVYHKNNDYDNTSKLDKIVIKDHNGYNTYDPNNESHNDIISKLGYDKNTIHDLPLSHFYDKVNREDIDKYLDMWS